MISLKKLLLETPEADIDDTFEQYFLGSYRIDKPAIDEPDTEEEKKLGKSLESHYGFGPYNKEFAKFIPTLIKYLKQGKYGKFLKTPGAKAYRLLADVNIDDANSILGIDLRKQNNFSGIVANVGKYKALKEKSGLSSWTIDKDPSIFKNIIDPEISISRNNVGEYLVWIMLEAETKNQEFILNPDVIEKNTKGLIHYNESEVISYGDIEISKAAYIILDPENKAHLTHYDDIDSNLVEFDGFEIINKLYKMIGA